MPPKYRDTSPTPEFSSSRSGPSPSGNAWTAAPFKMHFPTPEFIHYYTPLLSKDRKKP